MSVRVRWLISLVVAGVLLAPLSAGAAPVAADPIDSIDASGVILEPVLADMMADLADGELVSDTTRYMDATLADGRLSLLVRFDGPSVLETVGYERVRPGGGASPMSTAQIETIHRSLQRQQAPFERAFKSMGATIVGRFQVTMNGVQIHATADQLAEIVAMPGVAAVSRAPIMTLHNSDVRAHLRAEEALDELGLDGTGTTIAIIDTGVDYTHAGFGGPGTVEAYQQNDPVIVEEGTFPTEKVVGGYDFVGTQYSPSCPDNPQPPVQCHGAEPDEDPIDNHGDGVTSGHGSHVAGTAAGGGGGDVPTGVAPGAKIVALKVFGEPVNAPASTDLSSSAVEWATAHNLYLDDPESDMVPGFRPEDRIDVVNMSLGSGYGPGASEATRIVQAAVDAGITMVISAGNSGNNPYIVGSPSIAPSALTVSNTFARNTLGGMVDAAWENADGPGEIVDELATTDTGWAADLAAMGPITGDLAWYGFGCNDTDGEPVQDVTEKIALIERGNCTFVEKVTNAEANGAVAALIFTNEGPKGGMAGDCTDCPEIPVLMIDRAPGLRLRGLVSPDAGDPTAVSVTMEKGEVPFLTDTIAGSSSRGPARFSGFMKPNISAPGQETMSVKSGTGAEAHALSGTSMSGPAVAGVAALLWQRNKDDALGMSALDISALAMNYADPIIKQDRNDTGPLLGTTRQGAGLADAFRSATAGTVLRSDMGIAELSFGDVHVADDLLEITRVITVSNLTSEDKRFAVDYSFLIPDEDEGSGVTFDHPDSVEVSGADQTTFEVTLEVDPVGVRPWLGYGPFVLTTDEEPALRTQEVDGFIHLYEIDAEGNEIAEGDRPSVPFHLVPRRHTNISQVQGESFTLASADDVVEHAWVNNGTTEARVRPHYLGGVDTLESETVADHPAELDVGAVGYDYGIANVTQADGSVRQEQIIAFYTATAGPRRTIFDARVLIYVDSDGDGEFDRAITQAQLGIFSQGAPASVFIAGVFPLAPDTLFPVISAQTIIGGGFYVQYDIDEAVTTLAVPLAALNPNWNLDDGDVNFEFGVSVVDGMNDYEVTDTFLGEDMLPNDLVDGGRLKFNQAANACLMIEGTGPDGDPVNLIGQVAGPLPAGSQGAAPLKLACDTVPEGTHEVGILSEYRSNIPGMSSWDVRRGVIGQSGPVPIYLPYLSNGDEARPAEPAMVRVMHAVPGAPAVDVWVDGALAIENLAYQDITAYVELPSGSREVLVVATGTTEPAVLEATLDLAPQAHYTVAAVSGDMGAVAPLVLMDELSAPAEGMSHVRFVHLSPDAPAVDIAVTDGAVIFGDMSYMDAAAYLPVDMGSYDLEVRIAGSEDVALAVPGVMLDDMGVYTIFATGLAGGEPMLDAVIAQDWGATATMP